MDSRGACYYRKGNNNVAIGALGSVFTFILGLLIGSFLNVVILRLPYGQTLLGRSMCPHCGYRLRPVDLVPILSFLFLNGRCRQCRQSISWRYPVLELLVASLFTFSYVVVAPATTLEFLFLLQIWVVVSVCVATFVIDFEHYLILDSVTFTGFGLVLIIQFIRALVEQQTLWSVQSFLYVDMLGLLAGSVPFFLLWYFSRGKLLGFGDVKFMVFAGVALGWPVIVIALLLACWIGAVCAIPLLFLGKKKLKSALPFGTFLAIAVVITVWYGDSLWNWYISLLGV